MNSINAKLDKSDYEGYFDYLNFWIDDYWLDEKIDEIYSDKYVKGNIPTLLFALEEEAEQKVVWERILPKSGTSSICPILMCLDDCDFICTLIVAEIENRGDEIVWKKIGCDYTNAKKPSDVGTTVEWFIDFGELTFEYNQYIKMIDDFKEFFEHDKERYGIDPQPNRS